MYRLRIAVVSDLHCHPENNQGNNATLLFTDKLRDNSKEHPVENLIELKTEKQIENVDIVICPGDFTDKSNKQGLISGWDYVNEISNLFKANKVYATIGNHDIDSRHTYSNYYLSFPKGIKKNFPLNNTDIGTFWDKGFTFIECDQFRLLVIDTTHFHTHNTSTSTDNPNVKGKIDKSSINDIEKYLIQNPTDKIKIMLCHHHPKQHSLNDLGEHDFVENGEELLNVLSNSKFDLVIHGHKHDPWFGEHSTHNGGKILILSAGSFSATNQIQFIYKYNYFHTIDMEKDGNAKGEIMTWCFKNKYGWSANEESFPYKTGFGNILNVNDIIQKIEQILANKSYESWDNLILQIESLKYLLPADFNALVEKLESKNYSIQSVDKGVSYPLRIYNYQYLIEQQDKHGI